MILLILMVVITAIVVIILRASGKGKATATPPAVKEPEAEKPMPETPVETTPPIVLCRIVSKRNFVSASRDSDTQYYVTFEFENGDRVELNVPGNEFGLMVAGDRGKLSYQGSVYLSFARDRNLW